jgi:hypothetical protein
MLPLIFAIYAETDIVAPLNIPTSLTSGDDSNADRNKSKQFYVDKIVHILLKHDNEKLRHIDALLERYEGKEDKLVALLEKRYSNGDLGSEEISDANLNDSINNNEHAVDSLFDLHGDDYVKSTDDKDDGSRGYSSSSTDGIAGYKSAHQNDQYTVNIVPKPWHQDPRSNSNERMALMKDIWLIFTKLTPSINFMPDSDKTIIIQRIELDLFCNSESFEEYSDRSTLQSRLLNFNSIGMRIKRH